MQYSTAISDFILATSTIYASYLAFQRRDTEGYFGSMGLLTFVLAAIFGIVRFGIEPSIMPVHQFFSNFAAYVGVPIIGVSFISIKIYRINKFNYLYIAIALLILFNLFTYFIKFPVYATLIGGLANVGILIVGIRSISSEKIYALCAIGGSALTIIAGLFIGTDGAWFALLRIDLFHYVLSIANILLGISFKNLSGKQSIV